MSHIDGNQADHKGKFGESIAYDLAQVSFLKDWCFQNPRLENGKELCDLLIIFDDVMFIWQIKNIKLHSNGHYKDADKEKNLRQLIGAYNQIFKHNAKITLQDYGGVDKTKFNKVFLCSVFMGDTELSSELFKEIDNHLIHIIHRDTLKLIVQELDTVSDFIAYYNTKEQLNKTNRMLINGGEKELLAFYLMNNRDIELKGDFTFMDEGLWDDLQAHPQHIAKKKANVYSKLWDHVIEAISEESKLQLVDSKQLIVELLRPTRFFRRVLSRGFFEMIIMCQEQSIITWNRYIYVKEIDHTVYCFVYVDASKGVSQEEASILLENGCMVATYLNPVAKLTVGIAYIQNDKLHSFSAVYYKGPAPTKEAYEHYRKKSGRSLIVSNANENEYPKM